MTFRRWAIKRILSSSDNRPDQLACGADERSIVMVLIDELGFCTEQPSEQFGGGSKNGAHPLRGIGQEELRVH